LPRLQNRDRGYATTEHGHNSVAEYFLAPSHQLR
jgi:hypothetical protein